jgi:hypothetical protein
LRSEPVHPDDDLAGHPPVVREFWRIVRKRWPEFLPYATLGYLGDFEIQFPIQGEVQDVELYILADIHSDETVVAIHGRHSHGGLFCDPRSPDFMFFRSVQWIEELLNRELGQDRPQVCFCHWLYREMDGLEILDKLQRTGSGA